MRTLSSQSSQRARFAWTKVMRHNSSCLALVCVLQATVAQSLTFEPFSLWSGREQVLARVPHVTARLADTAGKGCRGGDWCKLPGLLSPSSYVPPHNCPFNQSTSWEEPCSELSKSDLLAAQSGGGGGGTTNYSPQELKAENPWIRDPQIVMCSRYL